MFGILDFRDSLQIPGALRMCLVVSAQEFMDA